MSNDRTSTEVWVEYQKTRSPELRAQILEENLGLLYKIAFDAYYYYKATGRLPQGMDRDDMVSLTFWAGMRFLNEVGKYSVYTAPVGALLAKGARQRLSYEIKLWRYKRQHEVAIDARDTGGEHNSRGGEMVRQFEETHEPKPFETAYNHDLYEHIMRTTNDFDKQLLFEHFVLGKTQGEIAKKLGFSRARLQQLMQEAINTVRSGFGLPEITASEKRHRKDDVPEEVAA